MNLGNVVRRPSGSTCFRTACKLRTDSPGRMFHQGWRDSRAFILPCRKHALDDRDCHKRRPRTLRAPGFDTALDCGAAQTQLMLIGSDDSEPDPIVLHRLKRRPSPRTWQSARLGGRSPCAQHSPKASDCDRGTTIRVGAMGNQTHGPLARRASETKPTSIPWRWNRSEHLGKPHRRAWFPSRTRQCLLDTARSTGPLRHGMVHGGPTVGAAPNRRPHDASTTSLRRDSCMR